MEKLRVIQWGTGNVGKQALRAVLDDPRLELVGVYAFSAEKVGTDAGELCGREPTGVLATSDVEALIALEADTVIYTPFTADLSHLTRLLRSGADVISTNLLINLGGLHGETLAAIEQACRRGGSSFLISGINPGWVNAITTALTAVCRQVVSVTLSESADCTQYESAETWQTLGMGAPAVTPEIVEAAEGWFVMFRDTVVGVADALMLKLDRTELSLDFASAAQKVDLGWFVIEQGCLAAVRACWNGYVGERQMVQSRITWYLTTKLAEGWDIQQEEYHIAIEGEPGLDTRIAFRNPPSWGPAESTVTTAMPVVNALFDLHAARPGVLGLRDVGLPHAPAGLWR